MRLKPNETVWSPLPENWGSMVILKKGQQPPTTLDHYLDLKADFLTRLVKEHKDQVKQAAMDIRERGQLSDPMVVAPDLEEEAAKGGEAVRAWAETLLNLPHPAEGKALYLWRQEVKELLSKPPAKEVDQAVLLDLAEEWDLVQEVEALFL